MTTYSGPFDEDARDPWVKYWDTPAPEEIDVESVLEDDGKEEP